MKDEPKIQATMIDDAYMEQFTNDQLAFMAWDKSEFSLSVYLDPEESKCEGCTGQASKAAKAPPKEQARASDLILSVITQVELIGRYVERSEVGVPSFAGQFLSDLIEADATIQARLSAILPVLQGLSDIASAVEA